jgi:hypothetical protein
MIRILNNQEFLLSIIKAKARARKVLVGKCSSDQLKAIIECIINCSKDTLSREEQKLFRPVILYFTNKSALYETKVKLFLIDNHKTLAFILCHTLKEIIKVDTDCSILISDG